MSTVWSHGVPWYDKALAAAERRGPEFVAEIASVANDYRRNLGSFAVGPEVDARTGVTYDNRVRVTARGHSAVIAQPDGVILGFGLPTSVDRAASRLAASARSVGRAKGRKAHRRGPRDFAELYAWLRPDYRVEPRSGGHDALVRVSDGTAVYTMPSTASDHRSFANCLSDIRKVTGLELRR